MKDEAKKALIHSLRAFPYNWSAWQDLLSLCSTVTELNELKELQLPEHWMTSFFLGAAYLEVQQNEASLQHYERLQAHFPSSAYIQSQIATCHYNLQKFDVSQAAFEEVLRREPYRLTSLDTYSNILYVKEESAALSRLARQAVKIDKYTPEACCIVGNYYSLKAEHEKAVIYYQRALGLNRQFVPALILMGHEFMEMKNTSAAIDAYRTAVTLNPRDYRAWYGLGQTYEMLNLHFYAILYYKRVLGLKPEDARIWTALGQCYQRLSRLTEAVKCYEKAYCHGDKDRIALPRLAQLHRDMGKMKVAAAYYGQVLAASGEVGRNIAQAAAGLAKEVGVPPDPEAEEARDELMAQTPSEEPLGGFHSAGSGVGLTLIVIEALHFLLTFYHSEGRTEECEAIAMRLLDTAGPERDEAKAMLWTLRSEAETGTQQPGPVRIPPGSGWVL